MEFKFKNMWWRHECTFMSGVINGFWQRCFKNNVVRCIAAKWPDCVRSTLSSAGALGTQGRIYLTWFIWTKYLKEKYRYWPGYCPSSKNPPQHVWGVRVCVYSECRCCERDAFVLYRLLSDQTLNINTALSIYSNFSTTHKHTHSRVRGDRDNLQTFPWTDNHSGLQQWKTSSSVLCWRRT